MSELNVVENLDTASDFELKHFPTLTVDGNVCTIEVGKQVPHPQTAEHYISKIDLYVDCELYKHVELSAEDAPFATIAVEGKSGSKVYAVENCNLHGDWKSEELVLG